MSDSDAGSVSRRYFDLKSRPAEPAPVRLSRRVVLKGGAASAGLAVGSGAVRGFPTIWAQNIKNITLRQFGVGASTYNEIAVKAKEDLGFTIELAGLDSDAVVQRAITQPKSFDIIDSEFAMLPKLVPTGNLQPMDITRIKLFDKVVPIFTRGEMPDGKKVSLQGTAPIKVSFLTGKDAKTFSKQPTQWFNLMPTIFNADTLGIRPDLVKEPITQWKQMLDPQYKGKASILNISSIGIMDAAMICESLGTIKYGDKGNMTKAEIDKTIGVLIDAKKAGQFRAFWKSFDESINLMASGEVVIQSMWASAVTAVRSKGIPCTYVALKEGYRSWASGLGLSRQLTGLQLDAAYEYVNWYLSGWVGAFLDRQGYYSAVPETAKQYMTADEWGFWMEGKPAQGDILDSFGKVMEKAGATRDGGSFEQRMGAVACWNSVMDENRYMVQKWNEFIAA
jgi:putative spermidine/putrescine transport system substrate-binding protein